MSAFKKFKLFYSLQCTLMNWFLCKYQSIWFPMNFKSKPFTSFNNKNYNKGYIKTVTYEFFNILIYKKYNNNILESTFSMNNQQLNVYHLVVQYLSDPWQERVANYRNSCFTVLNTYVKAKWKSVNNDRLLRLNFQLNNIIPKMKFN